MKLISIIMLSIFIIRSITEKTFNDYKLKISVHTIACIIDRFNYTSKRVHTISEKRNDDRTIEIIKTYAEEFILLPTKYLV